MTFEDIFKPKTAVLCECKEDSDSFRMFLSRHGVQWGSGKDPAIEDHWSDYIPYIIYNFEYDGHELRVYYGSSPRNISRMVNLIRFENIILDEAERECDSSLLMEFYM